MRVGFPAVILGVPMVRQSKRRGNMLIRAVKNAFSATVIMVALAVSAYTLSPFAVAAYLGSAIKSNDVATMDMLVDWQGVKASLRASILQRLDEKAITRPDKPGFVDKVKFKLTDKLGPYVVDYMLDERISPEGFALYLGPNSPQAQKYRAAGVDPDTLPSASTLKRIKRAHFKDLTHFVIEMQDRWDEDRVFLVQLELRDYLWRLAKVDVLALGAGV